jgi:hypothetical protein
MLQFGSTNLMIKYAKKLHLSIVLSIYLQNMMKKYVLKIGPNSTFRGPTPIGDSTCNACHHMVYTGRPSMKF